MKLPSQAQRELEKQGTNRWMTVGTGKVLIRAMSFADALRCADLLEDGADYDKAESDSGAQVLAI